MMKWERILVSAWPCRFNWFQQTCKCHIVEVVLLSLALDVFLGVSVLDAIDIFDTHTDAVLDMAEIGWVSARRSPSFAVLDPQALLSRLARKFVVPSKKFGKSMLGISGGAMRVSGQTLCGRLTAGLVLTIAAAVSSLGFEASAKSSKGTIAIELNKLEALGEHCQAYFIFDNKSGASYEALKVDLVVFRPDGVIERRFAMEVAPLEANKRTVKLFELNETACDKIGSLLVNGVLECKASPKAKTDCLRLLVPSSRVDVELTK